MNKDNKFPFMDLNRFMDEVFGHVEGFSEKFQTELERKFHDHGSWTEGIDFYPSYAYPPMNVYLTAERDLVIEMALAGFSQDDLELQFVGDYLHFSARPQVVEESDGLHYLKRRLKFKPVEQQKYYVPVDKFEQTKVTAAFKDGLLKIVIPSKEAVMPKEGIKVNINS